MRKNSPLVVIVGPTASGKTALAIRLARVYNGEIISADSRAIYRGLDVGTAKPSIKERAGVPHWGIDLVDPDQRFTVVDFQRYANEKIREIRQRHRVPFLVGGTGLYVDSVVYSYQFPTSQYDEKRRKDLNTMNLEQLHKYCDDNNIKLPENAYNKRYVVNNILRHGKDHGRTRDQEPNAIIVGIATEKTELWKRIAARAAIIWQNGLVDETRRMVRKYGWECEAMTGNTYKVARQFLDGRLSEGQAIERLAIADRQLAKRQLTWLRRSEHIKWLTIDDAYTYITHELEACTDS